MKCPKKDPSHLTEEGEGRGIPWWSSGSDLVLSLPRAWGLIPGW